MELLYDQYYENLVTFFAANPYYTVLRSSEHLGYAFMVSVLSQLSAICFLHYQQVLVLNKEIRYLYQVRWGLTLCTTTYALILQHDRNFTTPFPYLHALLQTMAINPHIRYIGFPTRSNVYHNRTLHFVYKLPFLTAFPYKKHVVDNIYLQPLIFWFDSNHLAHVQRYLEIFTPFKSITRSLKSKVDLKHIKYMLLKPGKDHSSLLLNQTT